eukprot:scaffold84316_cov17-Prasinocladus_malaysianus.AAC.1
MSEDGLKPLRTAGKMVLIFSTNVTAGWGPGLSSIQQVCWVIKSVQLRFLPQDLPALAQLSA